MGPGSGRKWQFSRALRMSEPGARMSAVRLGQKATSLIPARFSSLLVSLLLMITVYPFVETAGRGQFLFSIFFTVVLLNVVYTVSSRGKVFYLVIGLTLLTLIVDWAGNVVELPAEALIRAFLSVVLLGLVEVVILKDVLRAEKVTAEKIYGAVCVYLILGIQCAILFAALAAHNPSALSVPLESARPMTQMLYFSFVTMTTLGYGDISAYSTRARVLASVQALLGQLYLTVLVARLVALQITHEK